MNTPSSHAQPLTLGLLLITALTGAMAFLQVYSVQSVLPVLMADLHINAVTAGTVVGATVLGVALMSPFMGMLSDALGRRWLIISSTFCLSLPTMAVYLAQNANHIWWLRFIQGLSVPGITVVLLAYLGEEFSGQTRVRLMSFYVSGTVLGGFLGRFLLGYLDEWFGWRAAFLSMGSLSLLGGVLVWLFLPKSRCFIPKPNIAHAFKMLWQHLHSRYVLAACALGFCALFSLVGCFTYINIYLAKVPYALNSAELADIFAVYLLGVVITPLTARLILKIGINRTILLAIILAVSGILLTLSAPLWLIILGLALMSSGMFITQSATINYIAHYVSEGRSLASGLYYMAYYAGGFTGAGLCGYAFMHQGWGATVVVLIVAQTLAMGISQVLMVRRKLG